MKKTRVFIWATIIFHILLAVGFYALSTLSPDEESDSALKAKLLTRTLTQPVEHDRPGGKTFDQEIMILVPEGAGNDAPVFFILGNESDHTGDKLKKIYRAYGAPGNVIFIQAEHRGYGQSITADADQSLPRYIRIDQVLADYHEVVAALKKTYTGPWMAAGYSYGGGLVIHFAARYPEDVRVILASSAVVDWPFFMDEYDLQVRINLGDGLYKRLAGHTRKLIPESLFDTTWLEREFLTNMAIGMSQYKEYKSLVTVFSLLSYLPTRTFVDVIRWLDVRIAKEAGWRAAQSFGKKGLTRAEAESGTFNWYTWKYQQCTETGTFWVSQNPGGLFPKSKTDILDECRAMFGEEPPAAARPPWSPRAMLEGLSVPQIYVAGGLDPWKRLGLQDEHSGPDENYFFIPDGYHCPDRDDVALGKSVLARMLTYTD